MSVHGKDEKTGELFKREAKSCKVAQSKRMKWKMEAAGMLTKTRLPAELPSPQPATLAGHVSWKSYSLSGLTRVLAPPYTEMRMSVQAQNECQPGRVSPTEYECDSLSSLKPRTSF